MKQNIPCRWIKFDLGTISYEEQEAAQLKGELLYPALRPTNTDKLKIAQRQSVDWAIAMGLVKDPGSIQKLDAANFTALFASALCDKTIADLQLMADFNVFLFVLDDILDAEFSTQDKPLLKETFRVFQNIYAGQYKTLKEIPKQAREFPLYNNICQAIFDIRQRLEKKNQDLSYFVKSVEDHLLGAIWGTTGGFRNAKRRLPLSRESYLYLRKFTGAVKTVTELACVLCELDIPFGTRKNPVIRRIGLAGVNIICTLNDIVSLKKEIQERNNENYVLTEFDRIKALGKKNPLKIAVQNAITLHNSETDTLMRWKELLPEDDIAKKFYSIVVDCINDNQQWSFKSTQRYGLQILEYEENEAFLTN